MTKKIVSRTFLAGFLSFALLFTASPAAFASAPTIEEREAMQNLVRLSFQADSEPSDMKVAAPSSVMAATGSESPTRRVQEVNNWRPNTQSYIDAKTRLAQSSGLDTQKFNQLAGSVSRWQPILTKGTQALRGAGIATGDTFMTFAVREGVMYPMLDSIGVQDARSTVTSTYCNTYGNLFTDWLAGWVGSDCVDWRLDQEYNNLVGQVSLGNYQSFNGHAIFFIGNGYASNRMQHYTNDSMRRNTTIYCARGPAQNYTDTSDIYTIEVTLSDGTKHSSTSIRYFSAATGGAKYWCADGQYYATSSGHAENALPVSAQWIRKDYRGTLIETASAAEPINQDAEWLTRVRCLDGSIRTAVSESFQQEKLGAIAQPPSVVLDGCQPVGVDTAFQTAGTGTSGAGGGWQSVPTTDRRAITSSDVSTAVQDWLTNFPNCWDGSCTLDLQKVINDQMTLDCFTAPEQCVDWFTESQLDPTKYRCVYNSQPVALSECNVYAPTFTTTAVQNGTAYADPATGTIVTTGTGTTSKPVTTNPGINTAAMNRPVSDKTQSRNCFPSGWAAFNPIEWVLRPVQCSLEWAFVPDPNKIKSFGSTVKNSFSSTSIGSLATVVEAIEMPQVGNGCTGPPLAFTYGPINEQWYPFSACDAPMSGVAATVKAWLAFLISAGAILAIIRYATAVVGYVPFGGTSTSSSKSPRFEAQE